MHISKVRSQLSLAFEYANVNLQRMQDAIARFRRMAAKKHQELHEAVRERENRLMGLLTSSFDAIVLTNDEHCILAANPAALTLFGISEKNIGKFTIDAFLPIERIRDFERSGPPFLRGKERGGECQIRRLDGRQRLAEFSFQANFVPGRHLVKFHDITPSKAPADQRIDSGLSEILAPRWN
jgi:PAS domain S-box-containing protein